MHQSGSAKIPFEKLPDATETVMSGPLEANMVYQFTGPVIQVAEEFLLVQNIVTRQPFGMLVFGDPKKVGNVA